MKRLSASILLGIASLITMTTHAQGPTAWATVWAASAHGPFPSGNPSAQPNLSFAFPVPAEGARDQSMRMIVRPDLWAGQTRIRLTNAFGTAPVTFDDVFVGLQESGAVVVAGTNQRVRFGGSSRVTIPAGATRWSDAVSLPFATA